MSQLLETFIANLYISILLWVIMFVAFATIFASGKLRQLINGLGHIIVSLAVSPFVFMKKAVAAVIEDDHKAEAELRRSEQYLLNRLLLFVQAVVIVAAIAGLAAGAVATWNAWMPTAEVRQRVRDYTSNVERQREVSKRAADDATALDKQWSERKDSALAEYKSRKNQAVQTAAKALTAAEAALAASTSPYTPPTFARLKEMATRGGDVDRTVGQMRSDLSNSWYWLDDVARNILPSWINAWRDKAEAEREMSNVSSDGLRAELQPNLEEVRQKNRAEAERLAEMEAQLSEYKDAARLRWMPALIRAISTAISVAIFIWLFGVMIELAWLAIRVADDVHRMRAMQQSSVQAQPVEPADVAPKSEHVEPADMPLEPALT